MFIRPLPRPGCASWGKGRGSIAIVSDFSGAGKPLSAAPIPRFLEVIPLKQILCLSHSPWQARPNRTQQLLARLNQARILFFEPPPPKRAPHPEQGRRVRAHITVYTLPTALLPGLDREALQRRIQLKAAHFIQKVVDRHHFREPVLWCTAPDQATYLDRLAYRGLVYDCDREWGEQYLDAESDLALHAEVIFAASPGLVQRLSPCNDNIALVPNGVNYRMFQRNELAPPPHLAHLAGRPVLGRVGDLTGQVDLEPLLHAAQAQPDWTFLMLGRVTKPVAARLRPFPNILLHGPFPSVELPDYLCACTVLFDLIRADRRGSDIIPSHLYEYLATGKPIVMMQEPEQVEPFPDVVYTAYDSAGFLRRCRKALEEDPRLAGPRRQAYANQAAWANRAEEVSRILDSTGLF